MRRISITFGKVLVAALGAAAVGMAVLYLLPGGDEPTRVEAFLRLVVGGAAIGVSYLGLAMVLRMQEINDMLGLVRRKLGR